MTLRNLVTVDLAPDLYGWYKQEARRRSVQAGHRVGVNVAISEALTEYKARIEARSPGIPFAGTTQPNERRLPPLPARQPDEAKSAPKEATAQVASSSGNVFPASVPRAFVVYGALSIKSQYRTFLPANQEGLAPKDRTYFAVRFPGYGETQAYMSQGRLKIKSKDAWREIVAKLGIAADDRFVVRTIKPSMCYEVAKR